MLDYFIRLMPRSQNQIQAKVDKFDGLLENERYLRDHGDLSPASIAASLGRSRVFRIERDFYQGRLRRKPVLAEFSSI
jgi:hypothetical protein